MDEGLIMSSMWSKDTVPWYMCTYLSWRVCGLNRVSFQQTLKSSSQCLSTVYLKQKVFWGSITVHARYRLMTFTITHIFPPTWKAFPLCTAQHSSYSSSACHRRLRPLWTKQELHEEKWKVSCAETVVSVHTSVLVCKRICFTHRLSDCGK